MDQTDLRLCLILLKNSRTPIREVGELLGLSVAAVHGRIQGLRDSGIIKAFTARISLLKLQATTLLVWGTTRAASDEDFRERLTRDNRIYWISFGGAASVYVGAYLRSPAELDACASFILKEGELKDPVIGIIPFGSHPPEEPILDRADCRILRALRRDARKSVADVAEETSLSAKTVSRRLTRMVDEGSVELSMEWYPDAANDIMATWHGDLKPSADRNKAMALLMNKYADHLIFAIPLSNLPRFILFATWTGSMKELQDLQARLTAEEPFARLVPNVLYTGYMFDTWRDDLLLKWAGSGEPTR